MPIKLINENNEFVLPDKERVVLGRDRRRCDVLVEGNMVSRVHCEILKLTEENGIVYKVRDVGSTNGTYVNENKIELEAVLNNGDSLLIGQNYLEVRIE